MSRCGNIVTGGVEVVKVGCKGRREEERGVEERKREEEKRGGERGGEKGSKRRGEIGPWTN